MTFGLTDARTQFTLAMPSLGAWPALTMRPLAESPDDRLHSRLGTWFRTRSNITLAPVGTWSPGELAGPLQPGVLLRTGSEREAGLGRNCRCGSETRLDDR